MIIETGPVTMLMATIMITIITLGMIYLMLFAQRFDDPSVPKIEYFLIAIMWAIGITLLSSYQSYYSIISPDIEGTGNLFFPEMAGIITLKAVLLGFSFLIYDSQKVDYTAIKA